MNSRPRSNRIGSCALLAAMSMAAGAAPAQPLDAGAELIVLINDYRREPGPCLGESIEAAGPLAPVTALAQVEGDSGGALQAGLNRLGYLAAQIQLISIAGPTTAREAMRFLERRYCRALANQDHAEIGVAKDGRRWRIVLAKPLLSPTLRDPEAAGREIVRLANQARAQPRRCGKLLFDAAPPVFWDATLADIALAHSHDMAGGNFFDHRGPDGSQVGDRATRAGYAWRIIGENLATGQGSAESAMAAWLASPHHCENIMNRSFSAMGAAYAVDAGSDTVIYWTQVFARPRSAAAEAARR